MCLQAEKPKIKHLFKNGFRHAANGQETLMPMASPQSEGKGMRFG
jgi:hypothetical protein